MKIQGLAVLAIVIILPMAIILNNYSTSQIKTLDLQISYDSRLKNATYDAIKAFQLNMSNSTTSDLANSKMRDIQASLQTFYNSLGSNFNMSGYGENVLKDYVPAIVYTLYDGYYIYSNYTNKLDENEKDLLYPEATYKDGESIYGLKPYIYYSCRYKRGNDDFVITYTLDSYITIQGRVNNKYVNESGYLLSGVGFNGTDYTYKGVKIVPENNKEGLEQYVYLPEDTTGIGNKKITFNNTYLAGSIVKYPYKKVNGVKYYKETPTGKTFSMVNDNKIIQKDVDGNTITQNSNGIEYYKRAYELKQFILNNGLGDLESNDAVDTKGNAYLGNNNPYPHNRKIFKELENTTGNYIEDENSQFNTHKVEVIRNSIETNLMAAISNFNNVSTSDVNFAMPKLQDYEWEMLTKNISMISFLQGLSIGGKIYNGHAIVQNTINEDYVSEDSIYILNNGQYYNVTDAKLLDGSIDLNNAIGLLNVDFERRTTLAEYSDDVQDIDLKKNIYYYPREDRAAYTSVIMPNTGISQKISEYLDGAGAEGASSPRYKLAQIYYTSLGRERYGMYRVTN